MDGDGLVNVNDLLSMLSQFGADGTLPEDVNGDNIVNVKTRGALPALQHAFNQFWFCGSPSLPHFPR